ncbi:unnamed protein product, partial [Laminaria digitata]
STVKQQQQIARAWLTSPASVFNRIGAAPSPRRVPPAGATRRLVRCCHLRTPEEEEEQGKPGLLACRSPNERPSPDLWHPLTLAPSRAGRTLT